MWENIIIAIIVVACVFFIGRKTYRQLKGRETGCGCSCTACDLHSPTEKNKLQKHQSNIPMHGSECDCSTKTTRK